MRMNRTLMTGICIVGALAALAVFAPFISPYDPGAIDQDALLMPPSASHVMGTDSLGRDVFSRMAYGARISLLVGLIAVGIATLCGVSLGAAAGFYGGWVDTLIMRFADIMLCFPTFFLILAVVAMIEPSIVNIMAIIGLTGWMGTARLIRAQILSLREREFIQAAYALGLPNRRIIIRHLIPNAMEPVLVNATLGLAGAILTESSLSFLGIGVQPPVPSWGNMLTEARYTLGVAWWITVFPGMAILVTIIGFNCIGEGLGRRR